MTLTLKLSIWLEIPLSYWGPYTSNIMTVIITDFDSGQIDTYKSLMTD